MRILKLLAGAIAALAVLAALGSASATATSKPADRTPDDRAGQLSRVPAAPATDAAVGIAAASPGISPAARKVIYVAPGNDYWCESGNLCTPVWDPTVSKWKVFFLYNCARYSLSNWLDNGGYTNHQTGGVTSYFYGSSGQVLRTSRAWEEFRTIDWNPVYSIRNC